MAKKTKKKTEQAKNKSTDWQLGQPLAFPVKKNRIDINRIAGEVVEEATRGPFKPKQKKRKKK